MKTKRVFAGLGVVAALAASALPLSSYAATGTVAVDFTVGSTLSMTIDDSTNGRAISVSDITPGDSVNTSNPAYYRADSSKQTSVIKVTTNNASGYNLVASLPNSGALSRTGGGTGISMTAGGETIAESAAWGIRSYGASGWNNYLAFTTSGTTASATVKTTSAPTDASNGRTEIEYALKTASDTPSGNYATTVTYTATAN